MSRCFVVAWLLCAWVLWENSVLVKGGSGDVPNLWRIQPYASETKRECEIMAQSTLTSEARGIPQSKITTALTKDGTAIIHSDEGMTFMRLVRYVCLPTGTDPRPRYKE